MNELTNPQLINNQLTIIAAAAETLGVSHRQVIAQEARCPQPIGVDHGQHAASRACGGLDVLCRRVLQELVETLAVDPGDDVPGRRRVRLGMQNAGYGYPRADQSRQRRLAPTRARVGRKHAQDDRLGAGR